MIHSQNNYQLPNISILNKNTIRTFCHDNEIGQIQYNGHQFISFNNTNVFGLQRKSNHIVGGIIQQRVELNYNNLPHRCNKRIVILLESPHITEFSAVKLTGLSGPAMGSSGNRFDTQCIKVFNNNKDVIVNALGDKQNSNINTIYDMFFVNAIQYQCSLGNSPIKKEIRDFVFEALWNRCPDSFKEDLIERLNLLKPDLIINACTKELQKTCCNNQSISSGLYYNHYSFLTASNHVSVWNKNTVIL